MVIGDVWGELNTPDKGNYLHLGFRSMVHGAEDREEVVLFAGPNDGWVHVAPNGAALSSQDAWALEIGQPLDGSRSYEILVREAGGLTTHHCRHVVSKAYVESVNIRRRDQGKDPLFIQWSDLPRRKTAAELRSRPEKFYRRLRSLVSQRTR